MSAFEAECSAGSKFIGDHTTPETAFVRRTAFVVELAAVAPGIFVSLGCIGLLTNGYLIGVTVLRLWTGVDSSVPLDQHGLSPWNSHLRVRVLRWFLVGQLF